MKDWLKTARLDTSKLPTFNMVKKQQKRIWLELHPDRNYGNEKKNEEEFKKVFPVLEKLVNYYTRHSELLLLEDKETEELDLTEEEIKAIRKRALKLEIMIIGLVNFEEPLIVVVIFFTEK